MDIDLRRQIRSLVSAREKISDNLKQIDLQSKGIYTKNGFRRRSNDDLNNKKGNFNKRNVSRNYTHLNGRNNDPNSINVAKNDENGINSASHLTDSDIMDTSESRPKLDTNLSQGQRRIMTVNILGHLKKAKYQLDFEGTTEKNKRQKEVENLVEDKIRLEKERIETEVARELEEKKSHALNKLEEIQKQIDEKEDQLLKIKLIEHYKQLSSYIQTNTKPHILWLPNKMNDVTNTLLDNSKQLWQEKIDQVEIRFSQPEDVEMEI